MLFASTIKIGNRLGFLPCSLCLAREFKKKRALNITLSKTFNVGHEFFESLHFFAL